MMTAILESLADVGGRLTDVQNKYQQLCLQVRDLETLARALSLENGRLRQQNTALREGRDP